MKKYSAKLLILMLCLPSLSYGATTTYQINKNFDLVPNEKNGEKKVILITIDDGPSKNTKSMVETLKKHKAQAIFFINGINHKKNPTEISFLAKEGFFVGNHTWSHQNLKKEKNLKKVEKEIRDNSKLIEKETGSAPRFFRAPFGITTPYVKDLVKKDKMIYMNWSGAAKDWEKNTKDKKVFLKNVTDDLHPGEILLIHEHDWTSKYLDELLTTLEQKGYVFVDPAQITE